MTRKSLSTVFEPENSKLEETPEKEPQMGGAAYSRISRPSNLATYGTSVRPSGKSRARISNSGSVPSKDEAPLNLKVYKIRKRAQHNSDQDDSLFITSMKQINCTHCRSLRDSQNEVKSFTQD